MTEAPEKTPAEPPERPDLQEGNERFPPDTDALALPSHVAGSGALDRLVETARDYARQAASENTLKAYAKDWAHFARWCRMRGADPLPTSPQVIGLYIADLAAPAGKAPALSVSSIERRCRVALKSGHPQFVCHGLTEFHRLKGSGRGIEEALGSNRQRRGW